MLEYTRNTTLQLIANLQILLCKIKLNLHLKPLVYFQINTHLLSCRATTEMWKVTQRRTSSLVVQTNLNFSTKSRWNYNYLSSNFDVPFCFTTVHNRMIWILSKKCCFTIILRCFIFQSINEITTNLMQGSLYIASQCKHIYITVIFYRMVQSFTGLWTSSLKMAHKLQKRRKDLDNRSQNLMDPQRRNLRWV